MRGPEQVNAYHLRYTARIALICLVHLRLQKSLCVSRLNAHDWEVCFGKPVKEPLRQRAGLEANPFKLKRRILEHPQHMKFATVSESEIRALKRMTLPQTDLTPPFQGNAELLDLRSLRAPNNENLPPPQNTADPDKLCPHLHFNCPRHWSHPFARNLPA